MNLTRHLASERSPIRIWFSERFPTTRAVATEANRELRGGRESCEVSPPDGADASLVGMAVDYLLRCHLSADALDVTAARTAALGLDRTTTERAQEFERAAAERIRALAPWEHALSATEMGDVAMACAVLARFEQSYRAGPSVAAFIQEPLAQLRDDDTIDDLASAVIDEATLADIARLGRVAVEDHVDLRRETPLHLNPSFAQTMRIGGADADVIAGHALLDWKSTRQTRIVGRPELWQLVGYVLCDTEDEYALKRLGVSALRWRRQLTWSIDELLHELAEATLPSLEALRGEFADIVTGVVSRRQRLARNRAVGGARSK